MRDLLEPRWRWGRRPGRAKSGGVADDSDLVGSDPALTEAAWENLNGVAGLLPASVLPSTRTEGPRKAAVGG